ncbi:MAG: hypothetical protein DYG94_00330 [Leptolyngbya sp. PLA3]|nr:MAG: hypothetical protein EDM82_01545 [Cyanobacteria bacterium CYA]MCE7967182.1 hypothetical protein [Leptolyngbya sp. PL-A3]
MLTGVRPDRLIGGKAYDRDALDNLIAPHRSSQKQKTQDGRMLRRYKRRFTVERTISWIQHYRRLCIRREKLTAMFQAFLHLRCSIILPREVLRSVLSRPRRRIDQSGQLRGPVSIMGGRRRWPEVAPQVRARQWPNASQGTAPPEPAPPRSTPTPPPRSGATESRRAARPWRRVRAAARGTASQPGAGSTPPQRPS